MRDMDTFLNIFPTYRIFKDDYDASTRSIYTYSKKNDLGKPTDHIDRTFTKKKDFFKIYTEEILKIASMRAKK
jgi:CRISPR/Cas system CMR-associated protein Cmr5 small subunit